MKRSAGAMVLLAAVTGCVTTEADRSPWSQNVVCGSTCGAGAPRSVAGMQGPWGQPVGMVPPYSMSPNTPSGAAAARAMIAQSVPLEMVQQAGYMQPPGAGSGIMQAQCGPGGCLPGSVPHPGSITPPGVPAMPGAGLLPAGGPGMMPPGMGGPGVGVPGAVAAVGALGTGPIAASPFPVTQRTEIRFVGPSGMKVAWYAPGANGRSAFTASSLEAPGRYNFVQGAIYRLKLSDIPNRPGLELYPTLEVVPGNKRTEAFLAHSAVPVVFTELDFEQVAAGNFVVKVIYLPDPQFQDLATTGVDEVVSSQLEPGVDPIAEACRRGSILAIVRLGNIDLEAPNTPAMDAPSPYPPKGMLPGVPHGMLPGLPPQGLPPAFAAMGAGRGMPMPPNGLVPGAAGPMIPGSPLPGLPRPPAAQPPAGFVPSGADAQQPTLPDVPALKQMKYEAPAKKPAEKKSEGSSWFGSRGK